MEIGDLTSHFSAFRLEIEKFIYRLCFTERKIPSVLSAIRKRPVADSYMNNEQPTNESEVKSTSIQLGILMNTNKRIFRLVLRVF